MYTLRAERQEELRSVRTHTVSLSLSFIVFHIQADIKQFRFPLSGIESRHDEDKEKDDDVMINCVLRARSSGYVTEMSIAFIFWISVIKTETSHRKWWYVK